MLPESHQQEYQDFLTLLKKLQIFCTTLSLETKQNKEPEAFQSDILLLQQRFENLQPWFEQHILSLTEEKIEQKSAIRWQSIQTEIKREFRLLTTNILLLKSSRQIGTLSTRIETIKNNLAKLTDYCQIMVADY